MRRRKFETVHLFGQMKKKLVLKKVVALLCVLIMLAAQRLSQLTGRFILHSCKSFQPLHDKRLLGTSVPTENPKAQPPQRAQWGIKLNEIGSRLNWLLKSLGFYSNEAVDIRNSAMLYLNAREQAARPEFTRSLGEL